MKEFKNKDYQKEIRQKIPGYDLMLDLIFQAILPSLLPELSVIDVLGLASQADKLKNLADLFPQASLTVVEPSLSMLNLVREEASLPQTLYLNSSFEEAELRKSYQICSCLLVLQFVENPRFFLQKIYDSLDEGGVLILSLFSNQYLDYWHPMAVHLGANPQQVQATAANQSKLMKSLSAQEVEGWLAEIGFAKTERVCQILSSFVWIARK